MGNIHTGEQPPAPLELAIHEAPIDAPMASDPEALGSYIVTRMPESDPPVGGPISRAMNSVLSTIERLIPTYTVVGPDRKPLYTGIWRKESAETLAESASATRGNSPTAHLGQAATDEANKD